MPRGENMKVQDLNHSSKKTKELIKKTFAELMEEKKEIRSITVTELVKRADLSRGAFYSHYDSIYQVIDEFQEEILTKVFDDTTKIRTKEDVCSYFDSVFQFLDDHKKIYTKLLTSEDSILFLNRLNKKICTMLTQLLDTKENNTLKISFFTDGAMHLLIKYFRKQTEESLFTIRDFVKEMAILLFF